MSLSTLRPRRLIRPLSLAVALSVFTPLGAAISARPATAAPDLKPEPTSTSRLVTAAIPEGASRIGNTEPLAELIGVLKTAARDGGFSLADPELLLWSGADKAKSTEVKSALAGSLKKAGYEYQLAGEKAAEGGKITVFVTGKSGKDRAVLGTWTEGAGFLLLAWGEITPMAGKGKSAPAPTPARAEVVPATGKGAGNADALRGTWGFTTISGTTYWDKSTGAYLGSGTGGSQSYTFEPGGRYRMFNYIRSRNTGWTLETLTWEEGTVRIEGDQIILTPTGGKYQVKDNQVARNNYERPMRPDELEKKLKRNRWNLGKDSRTGRPALFMGANADSMVQFTRSPNE